MIKTIRLMIAEFTIVTKNYRHDINIDMDTLVSIEPGEKFLWGAREDGTELIILDQNINHVSAAYKVEKCRSLVYHDGYNGNKINQSRSLEILENFKEEQLELQ